MNVRLVHPHPRPGQAAEYARRWSEILAPAARRLPGFRAAYFLGDPAADRVRAVFVWDGPPGAALDRAMDAFREQCRDLTTGTGPAEREDLEVLTEA